MDREVVAEEKKIKHEVLNVISQDRVLNFSDGVFAFAATLLVLKIDIPQIAAPQMDVSLLPAFISLWPQYLANILSFLVIGYYWLNHHAIFGMMRKMDNKIVWLNIVFLIFLSFIPFPVDLYGDFFMVPMVVVFYSASLAVVGFVLALMWWYASRNFRLINKQMGRKHIHYYMCRMLVAPVVFTASIPIVYIHPLLAQLSWLFVIIGVVAMNKYFKVQGVSEIEKEIVS